MSNFQLSFYILLHFHVKMCYNLSHGMLELTKFEI
jgi:hypothetical protein